MFTIQVMSTTVLVVAAVACVGCVFLFVRRTREPGPAAESLYRPRTAVLLALRGAHPELEACIRALLDQDYPDYELRVVVDGTSGTTWSSVADLLHGADRASFESLRDPLSTCSRKCSALIQMVTGLPSDIEVVALVDGDVVPHRGWLRELVAPLSDREVGVTYGIPWYVPDRRNLGSLIRAVWWSGTSIAVALGGWIWGGSAALRVEVLRRSGIPDRWSHALSSDVSMYEAVRGLGLRSHWVGSLIMPNREACRARSFFGEMIRYLMVGRLYLPAWRKGVAVAGVVTLALLASLFGLVIQVVNAGRVSGSAAVGLGFYLIAMPGMLLVADAAAHRIFRHNGLDLSPPSPWSRIGLVLSMGLAHAFHVAGSAFALVARSISWRGVRYEVDGPWRVRVSLEEP